MSHFEIEDLDGWEEYPNMIDPKAAKMMALEQSKKCRDCYTVREVKDGEAKIIALALRGVLYEPVQAGEEASK